MEDKVHKVSRLLYIVLLKLAELDFHLALPILALKLKSQTMKPLAMTCLVAQSSYFFYFISISVTCSGTAVLQHHFENYWCFCTEFFLHRQPAIIVPSGFDKASNGDQQQLSLSTTKTKRKTTIKTKSKYTSPLILRWQIE